MFSEIGRFGRQTGILSTDVWKFDGPNFGLPFPFLTTYYLESEIQNPTYFLYFPLLLVFTNQF